MTMDGLRLARARLATAALLSLGLSTTAVAQEDLVAAGEDIFRRCSGCHAIGEDAENRVGPHLNEVVGRTAGTVEDYTYSDAIIEAGAGGLVWDEETLAQFLTDPQEVVPGTKMRFGGLRKEEDIAAVIAYLRETGGVAEGAEGEVESAEEAESDS